MAEARIASNLHVVRDGVDALRFLRGDERLPQRPRAAVAVRHEPTRAAA
jgi:hypothetical protein